jgi:hypothetical protein
MALPLPMTSTPRILVNKLRTEIRKRLTKLKLIEWTLQDNKQPFKLVCDFQIHVY